MSGVFMMMNTSSSVNMYIISGVLYGFGYSLGSVGIPNMYSFYYSQQDFPNAYATSNLITSFYNASLFSGIALLTDRFGSYTFAFTILLILEGLGLLFILLAAISARKYPARK